MPFSTFIFFHILSAWETDKLGKVITNTQEAACSFVHEVYRSK